MVEAVIHNRLGPIAKSAPDDDKDERLSETPSEKELVRLTNTHTVCIYTKDFRDEDDVLRVLQELEELDLLRHGRSIYYKSDAFTYLDLYSATASKYGLQASLYTSHKMLAAARAAHLSMSQNTASQQERKILKNFY